MFCNLRFWRATSAVVVLLSVAPLSHGACLPEPWTRADLISLKAQKWQVDSDTARAHLALGLLSCLKVSDPVLRDDLAFDALQSWLRGKALAPDVFRQMGATLMQALREPDPDGFGQPFAALVLAEVARADRIAALWSPDERRGVVVAAASWLREVRDYRGFERDLGWRHAVAHGADLLMQLALNPVLEKPELDAVLGAIAAQCMAANGHSYVFGEGERLMRPLWFVARRGLHSEAEWVSWFSRLAVDALPVGGAAADAASLARSHNLKSLLYPLYATAAEGADEATRARLRPGLLAALRRLP